MSPANAPRVEFRFQEVRHVAVMIQNAAAFSAAELILWLYLRLGQKPEKTVMADIFRTKKKKKY